MKRKIALTLCAILMIVVALCTEFGKAASANTRTIINSIPISRTCFLLIEKNDTYDPPFVAVYYCDDCEEYYVLSASAPSLCSPGGDDI